MILLFVEVTQNIPIKVNYNVITLHIKSIFQMKKIFYLLSFCVISLFPNESFAQSKAAIKDLGKIEDVVKAQLNSLLLSYYHLKNALVATHATDAQEMTIYFLSAIDAVDIKKMTPIQVDFFQKHTDLLRLDLKSLAKTTDLAAQRAYFHGISSNTKLLITAFKANKEKMYEQHCPMAFDNRGASWLSAENEIKNPYYGKQMMKCGSVIGEF